MPEKESELTYFFEGPLSFTSMAAQAFLHFGFIHQKKETAHWILSVVGQEGSYEAVLYREGQPAAAQCVKNRRETAHFLMDALSNISQKPLGPWGYLLGMRPTKALYPFLQKGGQWREAADHFLREEKVEASLRTLLLDAAACLAPYLHTEGTASFYMHVPFCPSHCVYCSFPSAILHPGRGLDVFAEALAEDTAGAGDLLRSRNLKVESIYMGGGTPTILTPAQMDTVLTAMDSHVPMEGILEKTVEAGRPDTISEAMLKVLSAHGIDRISLNPQTMQDRILRRISRFHSSASVLSVYDMVRRYPFRTVNMDFICGLPEQTAGDMEENLRVICQLLPENVTIHTLAVKRGSPFYGREAEFQLPSAESVETMLKMANDTLRALGYHPYYLYRQKYMTDDFANIGWALPGHDSVYNMQMIGEHQHVVSAGAGSVSKAVLPDGHRLRKLYMPREEAAYLERLPMLIQERAALFV